MLTTCPDLLCAVDLSRRSRSALIHAAALADHFKARLRVLVAMPERDGVEASLRIEALVRRFVRDAVGDDSVAGAAELLVRRGAPADAILRASEEERTDLIVIATHGHGVLVRACGSTTAHVLARASVPVLVVPAHVAPPPAPRAERLLPAARIILAPLDLHTRCVHDARIAAGLADAFGLRLVLLHVLARGVQMRAAEASAALHLIAASLHGRVPVDVLVARGEPAVEIGRLALDERAGAIVLGLRGDARAPGSPPGSIASAVLRQAQVLVVALPPAIGHRFHGGGEHRAGDGHPAGAQSPTAPQHP